MTFMQNDILLKLGSFYSSDFLRIPDEHKNRKKYSLDLVWNSKLGCPTLTEQPGGEEMWGKYWYKSGANQSMRDSLSDVVYSITKRVRQKEGSVWLDIASNDGTLLSFVPKNYFKIGIDPIEDKYVAECIKHADSVVQDYFNLNAWQKANAPPRADVVTSIAMFYDLQDPVGFVRDVSAVLEDNGLWVLQLSYTPLMLEQLAFDNICHEHWAYHSLSSIEKAFKQGGFRILDAELNDVNGGSVRVYAIKKNADITKFGSAPLRDVWSMKVKSLKEHEEKYNTKEAWFDFGKRMNLLRMRVSKFIRKANREGKSVWGYGASTKGNTLLQYFGLNHELIEAIAEKNPDKWGLYTIGTNIPIKSEQEMRDAQPDFVLVLPWHFISEFSEREREYLFKGGAFIVPCPKFQILTRGDLK